MSYKNRDMSVLERISDVIYHSDKSFSQMAKELDCTRTTLNNYRGMVSNMDVITLKKLCELEGVSADFILFGEDKDS